MLLVVFFSIPIDTSRSCGPALSLVLVSASIIGGHGSLVGPSVPSSNIPETAPPVRQTNSPTPGPSRTRSDSDGAVGSPRGRPSPSRKAGIWSRWKALGPRIEQSSLILQHSLRDEGGAC
ncbi:hypothetical protein CCHR01_06961 [Colletotrichum chrysophilum]|uniref:Uncharacterized protein n=1 Tax=Colletotrichum chrysophilum TaxID=1836956 RepID=A0AAD9ARC2_9PEZI|nr:hypothetical protein CCHR01_06961 [Colletotrichum chrysophilum]